MTVLRPACFDRREFVHDGIVLCDFAALRREYPALSPDLVALEATETRFDALHDERAKS